MILFAILVLMVININCQSPNNKDNTIVKLGHYLFFDTQLSANKTKSCASCHNPDFAFTDGYRKSITAFGENVNRNAPSLLNVAYRKYFTWADSSINTLQNQHLIPLYSKHPVELGFDQDSAHTFSQMAATEPYKSLLKQLKIKRINNTLLLKALASYLSILKSNQSPYDLYRNGKTDAITPEQRIGSNLFYSDKHKCSQCHSYPYFTTNFNYYPSKIIYTMSEMQDSDSGLYHLTKNKADIYRFAVPSLRNCSVTAPYFHNGSAANLYDVLKIHQPFKKLKKNEEKYIVAFLYSLTDSTIFANTLFKNPF